MKKRVISIVLAVAMLLTVVSVGAMSVSAADQNSAASSDIPEDAKIYFEIPDFWTELGLVPGSVSVYCHVFQIGALDPEFKEFTWQTRNEICTYDKETGKYSYPIGEKFPTLKDDADYGIIFSAKNTKTNAEASAYDLVMTTECLNAEVYVIDKLYENPVNSQEQKYASYWVDETLAAKYGPHAGITSMGVLQGEVYAPHEDKALAIANFMKDYSQNIDPEKSPCPGLCEQLGVYALDVYNTYATTYAAEIEAGTIPSLEAVAGYLGLAYPPATEEPATTEPVTTEPVTTEPVTTEPVTTEPVTTEPVTTEPVTTEPVTTEPVTTEPVTTEPVTTEPEPVATYCVAGDFLDPAWSAADNPMTAGTYEFDGATYDYALTVPNVAAGANAFKVTDGTWDNAWGKGNENYTFTLASECDVTIYFNSETKEIAVDAEALVSFVLEYVMAVGNGDGAWLNGKGWDLEAEENIMDEVEPGVWEITYEGVYAFDNYNVKFACNGSWAYNWGSDGVFNKQDPQPAINVPFDNATVTLRIDVNGFDFETYEGSVDIDIIIKDAEGYQIGDVNKDGSVDIKDATTLQIVLAKLDDENTVYAEHLADFNGDGYVNILDATYIQLYAAYML